MEEHRRLRMDGITAMIADRSIDPPPPRQKYEELYNLQQQYENDWEVREAQNYFMDDTTSDFFVDRSPNNLTYSTNFTPTEDKINISKMEQFNNNELDIMNNEDNDSLLQSDNDDDNINQNNQHVINNSNITNNLNKEQNEEDYYLDSETLTTVTDGLSLNNNFQKIDWNENDDYSYMGETITTIASKTPITIIGRQLKSQNDFTKKYIEGGHHRKQKKKSKRKKKDKSSDNCRALNKEIKDITYEYREEVFEPFLFCCATTATNSVTKLNEIYDCHKVSPTNTIGGECDIAKTKHRREKNQFIDQNSSHKSQVEPTEHMSSNHTVASSSTYSISLQSLSTRDTRKSGLSRVRYIEPKSPDVSYTFRKNNPEPVSNPNETRRYQNKSNNEQEQKNTPHEPELPNNSQPKPILIPNPKDKLTVITDGEVILENENTHLITTERFGEATLSPQNFQQPYYDSDTHQVKQIFRLKRNKPKKVAPPPPVFQPMQEHEETIPFNDDALSMNAFNTDNMPLLFNSTNPTSRTLSNKSLYTDENDPLHSNITNNHRHHTFKPKDSLLNPIKVKKGMNRKDNIPKGSSKPLISIDTSTTAASTIMNYGTSATITSNNTNNEDFLLGPSTSKKSLLSIGTTTKNSNRIKCNPLLFIQTKRTISTPLSKNNYQKVSSSFAELDNTNNSDIIVDPIISTNVSSLSRVSSNNVNTHLSPSDDLFPIQHQHPKQSSNYTNSVINTSSPIYQYCYHDIYIPSGNINFKITDSIVCNNFDHPHYKNDEMKKGPVVSAITKSKKLSDDSSYAHDTLHVGDHIVAINDTDTMFMKSKHVCKLLKKYKKLQCRKITVLSLVRL